MSYIPKMTSYEQSRLQVASVSELTPKAEALRKRVANVLASPAMKPEEFYDATQAIASTIVKEPGITAENIWEILLELAEE